MTTEKKVASEAVPSKASNTKATPQKTTRRPVRRATTAKPPVKRTRTRTTTATKAQEKPQPVAAVKVAKGRKKKAEKKAKSGKVKMERDSFTMPKDEYAQFAILKTRLLELGQPAKKSELLRAGIKLLSEMTDLRLKRTMATVPVIKTGRPKKKK